MNPILTGDWQFTIARRRREWKVPSAPTGPPARRNRFIVNGHRAGPRKPVSPLSWPPDLPAQGLRGG